MWQTLEGGKRGERGWCGGGDRHLVAPTVLGVVHTAASSMDRLVGDWWGGGCVCENTGHARGMLWVAVPHIAGDVSW